MLWRQELKKIFFIWKSFFLKNKFFSIRKSLHPLVYVSEAINQRKFAVINNRRDGLNRIGGVTEILKLFNLIRLKCFTFAQVWYSFNDKVSDRHWQLITLLRVRHYNLILHNHGYGHECDQTGQSNTWIWSDEIVEWLKWYWQMDWVCVIRWDGRINLVCDHVWMSKAWNWSDIHCKGSKVIWW